MFVLKLSGIQIILFIIIYPKRKDMYNVHGTLLTFEDKKIGSINY